MYIFSQKKQNKVNIYIGSEAHFKYPDVSLFGASIPEPRVEIEVGFENARSFYSPRISRLRKYAKMFIFSGKVCIETYVFNPGA